MNVKQGLKIIKGFFETHSLINTVKSGNQFNFNADSNILYPVAHIEYITQGTGSDYKRLYFLITIADIFDPNLPDSEEDIYSDSNETADDFLNHFANVYDQDYKLIDVSNIEIKKFTNGNLDRVCGCTLLVTFEQYRTASDCEIPYKLN